MAGVHWHQADLLAPGSVARLIREAQPTHLVHMAWIAKPGIYWNSPENEQWFKASCELFEAFAAAGGRRLFAAGTCAEYDWTADGVLIEDSSPLKPHTAYGRGKLETWRYVQGLVQARRLSAAWGRVFFPYGPHEPAVRLIPSVICSLLRGDPALCTSGRQRRDFLHVDDVAAAITAVLNSDLRGAVNIASGQAIAVREVVQMIGRMIGRPERVRLGAIADRPDDCPLLVGDIRRLREEVGWNPQYSLEQGLMQTVEWWQQRQSNGA